MPYLHLPADHDPADRDMAAALARVLNSADLYVTWTTASGRARPVVPARACAPRPRRGVLGTLLGRLSRRRAGAA